MYRFLQSYVSKEVVGWSLRVLKTVRLVPLQSTDDMTAKSIRHRSLTFASIQEKQIQMLNHHQTYGYGTP